MDNKEKEIRNPLTEGKILKPLLLFALPVLGSLVLQAAYGAVDLLVIGKYSTTADVSAVTIGTQLMHLITNFVNGLSMGTTVIVGRHIGAKRLKEAGATIGAGIKLFACVGVLASVLIPLFAKNLAALYQTPEAAVPNAIDYITVCGIGMIFVVAYNLLGSIFRGMGDSKTPLISVMIACVLNIFGDIYFVKYLGLAAKGAALATVISQAVSVVLCFFIIKKRGLPFEFGKESFKNTTPIIKNTIKLGIPIAFQSLMVGLSFSIILVIVNKIGLVESAGMGVAEKVCAFVMLIPTAFAQSLAAFVAQNMGAGKPERANKGLKYSITVSLAIAVLIAYVAFFHGNILTGIFSSDEAVIMAGWDYLKPYALDALLTSFMFCFVGYFNGLGKTRFVMLQGILSAFCVRVPVSLIMSKIQPVSLTNIGLATPCSTLCQVIACLIFFRHCSKEMKNDLLQ